MREVWWALLLGVIEGVTEFLPVSSTGHLLLCQEWLGIDLENDPFWRMFTIFIQIGAIFAVLVYFRQRIADLLKRSKPGMAAPGRPSPLMAVLIGTVPVLVIGYLARHWVDRNLGGSFSIAMALGIGGIVMIAVELLRPRPRTMEVEAMTWLQAVFIGCAQVLAALFPGTSRSAATIIGGMTVGMSREAAAEFSFFLAIPAMFAACGYKLLQHSGTMSAREAMLLSVGTLVSFLVAWVVIAAFMSYIRRRSFISFAVYRILLAGVVLLAFQG